jgi:hypothetical protein
VFEGGNSCMGLSPTVNAFNEISKEDEEGNAQCEVSQEGLIKVTNMLVNSMNKIITLCNQIDSINEKKIDPSRIYEEISVNLLTFENLARHELLLESLPEMTSCWNRLESIK